MAAGTAVVASDLTGYRAVARTGAEARLVPPGDTDALRAALQALLDDPAARGVVAAAGRARAEALSMARLAEEYEAVYREAVGSVRRPASVARPVRLVRGRRHR
jgi:phosphatidylinositol alpha-mannosyltransferase